MSLTRFYLGTHMPSWLTKPALAGVPLFVAVQRFERYRTLRPAVTDWALDSGGFSEIQAYGEFRTTAADYVRRVAELQHGIGRLDWAAPQDWMCEPEQVARTGLTVPEHQRRTVDNFLTLTDLWAAAADGPAPFIPVLQGYTLADYWRCVDLYTDAGVRLVEHRTIGIGSVCKREATEEIGMLVRSLGSVLRLHGFGVKTEGLAKYGRYLTSADSLAWSKLGRGVPGCETGHKREANCLRYALAWRASVLAQLDNPPTHQPGLFTAGRETVVAWHG